MQSSALGARAMTSLGASDGHPNVRRSTGSNGGHDVPASRRNPLACEACYKKKIKCEVEGFNTACIQCMRRNVTCKFTVRKEKRENLKRAHYVKDLEERLKRTESLLKAAGLLSEDLIGNDDISEDEDDQFDDDSDEDDRDYPSYGSGRSSGELTAGDATRDSAYASVAREPISTSDARNDATRSSSYMTLDSDVSCEGPTRKRSQPCTNTIHHAPAFRGDSKEDSRYYGRSSFLSILSRDGIEWIRKMTGDSKLLSHLFTHSNHDSPLDYWRPDVFYDVFSSKVFKPLPPRAEVFSLLRDYFRTVNRLFPLYHEAMFMRLVEWQYTQQTCNDAARWASINIILSLAYEYRFSNSQKSEKDREKAWLYFKNAMSVFAELTLRRTDILSVQALLGMALFLRGNSGTQSALPIITAAIRSCHRMGLHRDIPRPHLSQDEQEQRKRVFWTAYILDQSSCIRAGNAPAQHPDDFDVGFPAEDVEDEFVMSNNTSFFRQLCHMTVIKSRIYTKLYSATALQNKSPIEICKTVQELHTELEEWKGASPFIHHHLKQRGSGDDFLVGFASAGLQFVYYNSLIMIHRLPLIMHFAYTHRLAGGMQMHVDSKMIKNEAAASAAVCVQAARDTLKLVNNLPWGDIAWIWSLLYYIFLAVMTIFVSILRDPGNPKVQEDLQSLNMASTFFATLIPGDRPCNYARFMTRMCANFERIARMVLERDQKSLRPEDKTREPATASSSYESHASQPSIHEPPSSPHMHQPGAVNIPNLDGLPRINSSGYVVPDSPSDTTPDEIPLRNPLPQNYPIPDPPLENTRPRPQPYRAPYPLENMFPFSVSDSFQPELWQIPLTADWELGSQFLGGLFGQTGPVNNDPGMGGMPGPATSMDMGGYGYQEPPQGGGQPMWMDGGMGGLGGLFQPF